MDDTNEHSITAFHWDPYRCPDCGVHRTALGEETTAGDRFGWVYCSRCDEYKLPNGATYSPGDEEARYAEVAAWLYESRGLTLDEIIEEMETYHARLSKALYNHPDVDVRDPETNLVEGWERNDAEFRYHSGRPLFVDIDSSYTGGHYGYEDGVYIHRLVAVAKYGFDAVADSNVMFANGAEVDTSIENVVLSGRSGSGSIDNEEMLGWVRAFYAEYGIAPTSMDMRDWPGPSLGLYIRRFGGVPNAIEAAGVPLRKVQKNHPRRNGLEELPEST